MKTSLWIVIVVVVFFVGFLVGYTFCPGGQGAPAGTPAATDKAR
ncbi:MAG TPA: hypothetical protein VEI74_14330 [Candidatus Methylomirabilis sp.]|nr:hypothetical protein [Candidatus Methylomirabilis sp.]